MCLERRRAMRELQDAPAMGTQEQRDHLVLNVAWELDKIARTMPDLVPVDDDQTHYIIRALAGRMLRLTNALMDLAGRQDDLEMITRRVTLEHPATQG